MRCILTPKIADTYVNRKKYFFDSLHLWMIPFWDDKGYVEMRGIPLSCENVCFIIGHRDEVKYYIKNNKLLEDTVVLITCQIDIDFIKKYLKSKSVFMSKQTDGYSQTYEGKPYKFDFDITKSEIVFYNKSHISNLGKRLEAAFDRVL